MQLNLKLPIAENEINAEVTKLLDEIKVRDSEIKILKQALKLYRDQCSHPGQETGYNERDGNWGDSCPICYYSY